MSKNVKDVIDVMRAIIHNEKCDRNFFFSCKDVTWQKGQRKVKNYKIYVYAFGGYVGELVCQNELCTHLSFKNVKEYLKYNQELIELPPSNCTHDIQVGLDYFKRNVHEIITAYRNRAEGTAPSSGNENINLERNQETTLAAVSNRLNYNYYLTAIEIERKLNDEKAKADLVLAGWDGEFLTFYLTEYKCTVGALVSSDGKATLEDHYDKMSKVLQDAQNSQDTQKTLYEALCIMLDTGLIDVCGSGETSASDVLAAIKQLPEKNIRLKMLFLFSDIETLRASGVGKKALMSGYKYIQERDAGRKDAFFYVIPSAEWPLSPYELYVDFKLTRGGIKPFVPLFKSEHAFVHEYWKLARLTECVDEDVDWFGAQVCSAYAKDADLKEMRFHVGYRKFVYLSCALLDSCELVFFQDGAMLRWKPCIREKNGMYTVEIKEELKKHNIAYRDCGRKDIEGLESINSRRLRGAPFIEGNSRLVGTHGIYLYDSLWLDDVSQEYFRSVLYTRGSHMFCGVEVREIHISHTRLGDWTVAKESLEKCNYDEAATTEFLNRLTFNGQDIRAWRGSGIWGNKWSIQYWTFTKFPDGVLELNRAGKETQHFTPPEGNGDNAEWIVPTIIECLKILRDESDTVCEGNTAQGAE